MSRTWKPGNVALLPNGRRAVVTPAGNFAYGDEPLEWAKPQSYNGRGARPLIVIDPEDRQAVAAFCDALTGKRGMAVRDRLGIIERLAAEADAMQAALREYANPTPPQPAEPTDPSARAIERDGGVWASFDGRWYCLTGADVPHTWDDLLTNYGPLEVRP